MKIITQLPYFTSLSTDALKKLSIGLRTTDSFPYQMAMQPISKLI